MAQRTSTDLYQSNFCKLPTELILTIFDAISSPRDLYALIQVSSITYNIFVKRKSTVLTNIVRQGFHPDVLPLAVLLSYIYNDLDAQKFICDKMDDNPSNCSIIAERGTLPEYPLLGSYINLRQELIDLKDKGGNVMSSGRLESNTLREKGVRAVQDDLLMLSSLCRIYDIVEAFIHRYSMDMLNSIYWKGKRKIHGLSENERGRFQRATLNYMTFDYVNEDKLRMRYQWKRAFKKILNTSESRELNSLYYHIGDWIYDCFDCIKRYAEERNNMEGGGEIRDAIFTTTGVRRHSSVQRTSSDKLRLLLEKESIGESETFSHIIGKGIPFCTRFFGMTMEEKIDVALPLSGAFTGRSNCRRGRSLLFPYRDGMNTQTDRLTVHRYRNSAYRYDNAGMRSAGYYFWDEDRLQILEDEGSPTQSV